MENFWQYGPQQIFCGLITGFGVTPFNTIMDKTVIQSTSGKRPLWTGFIHNFNKMVIDPKSFFLAYQFRRVLLVYHATYITSNLADHLIIPGLEPAISKLLSVFVVNSTFCIMKDKALAQRLGEQHPQKKFPLYSIKLFLLRDIVVMSGAFTIPSIVAKYIQKYSSLSQINSKRIAQLVCPPLLPFIGTFFHILALDIYNRRNIQIKKRFQLLKRVYFSTSLLTCFRIIPAYGIGGVFNMQLRRFLLDKQH